MSKWSIVAMLHAVEKTFLAAQPVQLVALFFSTSADAVWAWCPGIVEGREEESDGGEKNKDTQHNPNQTTQSPQAESTIM